MVRVLKNYAWVFGLALVLALPAFSASAQPRRQFLEGMIGVSPRGGSGWLDLANPMDFAQGDRLQITVGGTARNILVRLLAKEGDPKNPVGIVNGVFAVPQNRMVEVTLDASRTNIIQISVHGGPNPWNFSLGANNGPATIVSVVLIRAR